MVIYRCGYIVMYSTIIIGKFRYIIIIIYEVPTIRLLLSPDLIAGSGIDPSRSSVFFLKLSTDKLL